MPEDYSIVSSVSSILSSASTVNNSQRHSDPHLFEDRCVQMAVYIRYYDLSQQHTRNKPTEHTHEQEE